MPATDVSILGCGWLGLPLAEALLDDGHTVRGSTTTESKMELLDQKGIDPFLIRLNPDLEEQNSDRFWESELLILNIPPGRGREEVVSYHPRQIESVILRLADTPISKLIFVSSTSVYPARGSVVTESDVRPGTASRPSGNALIRAEQLLQGQPAFDTTVLRMGGLYGYGRHPVRYLAGRTGLERGNAPVNLIHRDDAVQIIRSVIAHAFRRATFNAVSDLHPPRNRYYPAAAKALNLEPPQFVNDADTDYRVVSNRALKEALQYTFQHPDPMDFSNDDTA